MRRLTVLLALLLALAAPAGAGASAFPERVDLPNGFAPEGIAVGPGHTFYTGSLVGVGIWRGDLRSGAGELLVDGDGPFVGMDVDARGRLWVAGGPDGVGYVFDAATGAALGEPLVLASGGDPTFVNDVVVLNDAAYFTDSMRPAIYRVPIGAGGSIGAPEPIPLDPAAIGFVADAFNLNGIDATQNGKTLIVVNSTAGALYRIDVATLQVSQIDLGGGDVVFGDGILLHGTTLYVVQNQLNQIAVVELEPGLGSATLADPITSAGFSVPTTIARHGGSLYAVNARFGTPVTPETEYWVTRVDR